MSIPRILGLRGSNQPPSHITYYDNPTFLRRYKELTNREWNAEQSTISDQVVLLNKWIADCNEQYIGSGRHRKCDALRAHWVKEVGLPGLTCGRHSPSKEDLAMLALPFLDSAINANQRKLVIAWAATKAAKNAIAATEKSTNDLL